MAGPILTDTAHYVVGFEAQRLQTPLPPAWATDANDAGLIAVADSYGVDLRPYTNARVVEEQLGAAYARFDWQITQNHALTVRGNVASVKTGGSPSFDPGLGPSQIASLGSEVEGIDLSIDIGKLKIKHIPFIPDVIWASPDCKTYTISACSTHRNNSIEPKTEYAKKCDRVNQHWLKLIKKWQKLNPKLIYYIENPRGMMRKMPWIQKLPIRHTIWYCQYGDTRAKPTDIWTNNKKWKPRAECHNFRNNIKH